MSESYIQRRRVTPLVIRTPDQRLRVFVSSTLQELAQERTAAQVAITRLHLTPILFELGARPHPPRALYRAYLEQSHIFIGIYWQRYGWVAPGESLSGLEDEYRLSGAKPKLIYIKTPAPDREERLGALLERIRQDDQASYKYFSTPEELGELIENDLALLLSERFEVAQVAEGMPEQPTPAATRYANNLPVPPTPLVGREGEVEGLRGLLLREGVRLVTVSGPGGVGKSRLAVQVASALLADFADGVFFVPLASVRDPDRLIPAVAEVLGLHESSGRPLLDSLKDYLRTKRLLLLLDNFEQLLAAAPVVSDLLAAAPHLHILVTSRAALHLRGEHEFPVPPLSLPELDERQMTKDEGHMLSDPSSLVVRLSSSEAVRLFIERAQAVKPDFALTPENALAVAEICRRLDGLPLAIELAAARVLLLPPQALLARLGSRLNVLIGGPRDLPARQHTLRDTIDWSYNLLSQEEQRLFARLGVFVRGCTFEALQAVCDPDGTLNALEVAASLADKSLLRYIEQADSEPRFAMLETIREFAQEKLRESGEVEAVRVRHLDYFLTLAEKAEPQLKGPQQMAWLHRLEAEHDNLRAALARALAQAGDDSSAALRLAAALHWFWFVRGYWSEGREWLAKALATDKPLPAPPSPDREREEGGVPLLSARARALNAAGLLAWYQGDVAVARALLEESVTLCRQTTDQHNLAYALAYLSTSVLWMGDAAEGRAQAEESAALFEQIGDRWGCAYALLNAGVATYWQGDYTGARTFFEHSLALFRAIGDKWRVSGPLVRLGDLAYRQGDYRTAGALYQESLAIVREMGDKPSIIAGLNPLGDVARVQGDYAQAAAFYNEGLALSVELGDKLGIAWARYSLGKVAWLQGDRAPARVLLEDGLALLREVGDQGGIAWLLQNLGHLALEAHMDHSPDAPDRGRVAELFQEAMTIAQEQGHTVTLAFCLLGVAGLAAQSGQPERAAQLWGAAQALCRASGATLSAADAEEYAHHAQCLSAIIDPERHPMAVAEGRAMTLDQAIAIASLS